MVHTIFGPKIVVTTPTHTNQTATNNTFITRHPAYTCILAFE